MSQSRGGNLAVNNHKRTLFGLLSACRQRRDLVRDGGKPSKTLPTLLHQNDLLLRSVGEGIYGIGMDGIATFANPAATLLGYPVEELLGRNLHDLLHHTRPDGSPFPVVECPIYRALTP